MTTRMPRKIRAMNVSLAWKWGTGATVAHGALRRNRPVRRRQPKYESIEGRLRQFKIVAISIIDCFEVEYRLRKKHREMAAGAIDFLVGDRRSRPDLPDGGRYGRGHASALAATAKRFYDMAARGDSASLRQNAIASLASNFSGIESAVKENQANLTGVQAGAASALSAQGRGDGAAAARRVPVRRLRSPGTDSGQRGLRDSQSAAGKLRHRHPRCSLPAGRLHRVFCFAAAGQRLEVGRILRQARPDFGPRRQLVRQPAPANSRAKGQLHNAWFYFGEARELLVPVPFMATATTDRLYDEMQAQKPADLPPLDLTAGGKDLSKSPICFRSR